jgi:hypothetical protein
MASVLRGYNWNFSTVYSNVSPIQIYPNQEYSFEYRYPFDAEFLRRFWNGRHTDSKTDVIHFVTSNDSQGRTILTNHGPSSALTGSNQTPTSAFTILPGDVIPVLEYSKAFSTLAYVPSDFAFAFSLMLAGWIAPSLPSVGVVDMREKNLKLGSEMMARAMARDANEARPDTNRISELAKARQGTGLICTPRGFEFLPSSYTP